MAENVSFKIQGSSGTHTYSAAEKRSYCDFINGELADDQDLAGQLPMNPLSDDLFKVIAKGVLLCKLINKGFPGTVLEQKLAKKPRTVFETNQNHELCIKAAREIGAIVVNIGAADISEGETKAYLVMGLLWQIIKRILLSQIEKMDLQRFMAAEESDVPPEQILLRWFNYHLKNSGFSNRQVANFTSDIQDAENYAVLLAQLAPDLISSDELEEAFKERDFLKRAELVLAMADKLGCRKFVTAEDIVDGNPNLNMAFVATLFRKFPCTGPSEEELARRRAKELEGKLDDVEGKLDNALSERDSLQSKLNKTKLDIDELQDDLNKLKTKFSDSLNEKDSANARKKQLEELIDASKNKKSDLDSKYKQIKADKDELLSQLEEESSLKLQLQTELDETKSKLNQTKLKSEEEISTLQMKFDTETSLVNNLALQIEEMTSELEKTLANSKKTQSALQSQIDEESSSNLSLKSKLDSFTNELDETNKLIKEVENTKDELFKLLNDTFVELELTRNNAAEAEEELRNQLANETSAREAVERELKKRTEELERALLDWDAERQRLLARIRELEEEIAAVKAEMRMKLEKAEKAKEDALALAALERAKALAEAENEKDLALDKVRLLLSGNQKQGALYRQETNLVGAIIWKKRFFVLRDNLLCWYAKEKDVIEGKGKIKPLGVIYCEEARLYEITPEEIKRDFVFQIDTGKVRFYVSANNAEEMKEWVTEIRVAKKKKIGVKVVSEETKDKRG